MRPRNPAVGALQSAPDQETKVMRGLLLWKPPHGMPERSMAGYMALPLGSCPSLFSRPKALRIKRGSAVLWQTMTYVLGVH